MTDQEIRKILASKPSVFTIDPDLKLEIQSKILNTAIDQTKKSLKSNQKITLILASHK